MLKGILEGCILLLLEKEECYGYKMVEQLSKVNLPVAEGSIYPLLLKLQKEKKIVGELKPSNEGPMRKYYRLTKNGEKSLETFKLKWGVINHALHQLIAGETNQKQSKKGEKND